jgi:hypothetical protein
MTSLKIPGSNPIISIDFGSIHFGKCTLFIDRNKDGEFSPLVTATNRSTRIFVFEIDPVKILGSGKTLSDLVGCEVAWTTSYVNFGSPSTIPFSFTLEIKQDNTDLIVPPFFQSGTIIGSSNTFGSTFPLA